MSALRAHIERVLSPTLGTCFRCRRPWRTYARKRTGLHSFMQLKRQRYWGLVGVDKHETPYKPEHRESGCFPLCEGCWAALTPEARLPFYDELVDMWKRQAYQYPGAPPWDAAAECERYETDRVYIRAAVLSGR